MTLRLVHLTSVGPGKPPATIEFAPKLTAIVGASDSGKSYVVEMIDFLLGARSLREVPEGRGYTQLLLGLSLSDGSVITLARAMSGGRIFVFERDLRALTNDQPDHSLAPRADAKNAANISTFLLDDLGLSGMKVRRNRFGQTQRLGLRNLLHLSLVSETRMQARTSPIESGDYNRRTAERSVFRLLLDGEDDATLTDESPDQFRRYNRGRIAMLETVIEQTRTRLQHVEDREVLDGQAVALRSRLHEATSAVATIDLQRAELLERLSQVRSQHAAAHDRWGDVRALQARFGLLHEQYTVDIERLIAVREAGTFLGYFDDGPCIFCGALPEHQTKDHATLEATDLAQSADAEIAKISALRSDLETTTTGLDEEVLELVTQMEGHLERLRALEPELRDLELQLEPVSAELDEFGNELAKLEQQRSLLDQLLNFETLLSDVQRETPNRVELPSPAPSSTAQQRFSDQVKRLLVAWGVPDGQTAQLLSTEPPDLFVDGRPRSARGKGVRSVLHAAFTVALSEYCLENELPFLGFAVLDTPMLTYRDPDQATEAEEEEEVSPLVAEAFFGFLQTSSRSQVVVLENREPQGDVEPGSCEVHFTGQPGLGRSGFFPL